MKAPHVLSIVGAVPFATIPPRLAQQPHGGRPARKDGRLASGDAGTCICKALGSSGVAHSFQAFALRVPDDVLINSCYFFARA